MKKTIIYILGIAGLTMSCTPQNEKGITISILHDQTDSTFRTFDKVDLLNLFDQKNNIWCAKTYRFQALTDSEYNPIREITMVQESEILGNVHEREEALEQFRTDVWETSLQRYKSHYDHSSIWQPLWTEIALLSKDTTHTTTIYCLSDALEHSYWVSMYDLKTRDQLVVDPDELRKEFFSRIPDIQSGRHLHLCIVHQPSESENAFFKLMMDELYRPACKKYGISFSIQAIL